MEANTSYQLIQNDPQVLSYRSEESSFDTCGKITAAIAIIVAIGAIIANGCFYSLLGNYSFAIGGGGLGLSLLLFIFSTCCRTTTIREKNPPPDDQKLETADPQKETEAKAKQEQEAADRAKQERENVEKREKEAKEQAAKRIADIDAKVKADLEAKIRGPFDPDKFRAETFYRQQRLLNNNWFSNDSAKNKELFGLINPDEFLYVKYDQLPDTVKKEIYETLKGDAKKAQEFFSYKLSSGVIEMMDERDIATIFGEDAKSLYPQDAFKKLTPEMQRKYLKSILENYDAISNDPKAVVGFAVELIHAVADLDPKTRDQEFEKIFDLLMNTGFKAKLDVFFEDFLDWRFNDDTILMTDFPLFFVKKACQHPDKDFLIQGLLTPALNIGFLNRILPGLSQDEKMILKDVLTHHNFRHEYDLQLDMLKNHMQ